MPLAVINDGKNTKVMWLPRPRESVIDIWLVKDEALKNLMMSWYYAGYYTGLYEGQQQVENTLPFKREG